jgi:acyl-CoA reductase-like NAD-dependent aldehyde dehydrogenase
VNIKLAFAAAMKARRTWNRIPPEQRKKMLDAAVVQARTHGPVVAKKISDTAKTQGPVVAKKMADTAKTHGPVVAKKISDTLERKLNKPS